MKVLTVDVGNSRVKIGVFVDFYLPEREVFDDLEAAMAWGRDKPVEAVAVSSVVPEATDRLRQSFPGARFLGHENPGIRIFYETPETLGPDRIANALYVKYFLSENAVVADVGTGVTVDPIGSDGAFYGGAIFPGPDIAARSLAEKTALLPRVDVSAAPIGPLGKDTESSIRAGVLWSCALAVEGIARAQARFLGWDSYRLVLTGGLASPLYPIVASLRRCSVEPTASLLGLGAWVQDLAQ